MITGTQVKTAMRMVGVSQRALAAEAEVSLSLVNRLCRSEGVPNVAAPTLHKVQLILEAKGIRFLGLTGVDMERGDE